MHMRVSRSAPSALLCLMAILALAGCSAWESGPRAELVYQALPVDGRSPTAADMSVVKDIVERRVNATGVAEPSVSIQGSDRIVVELPGVSDVGPFQRLIGPTGLLEFVPIPAGRTADTGTRIDPELPVLFDGRSVTSASPLTDDLGAPAVDFTLDSAATDTFAAYTQANVGNQFAIVLDGTIIAAPVIQSPISAGKGRISGGARSLDVDTIITVLRSGPLPFPLQEISSGLASPAR